MTVTTDQLKTRVNSDDSQDDDLEPCLIAAQELLDRLTVDVDPTDPLPEAVYDRAWLAVAEEMWDIDHSANGVVNQVYDEGDGEITSTPARISSDPLRPAYPILAMWLPVAIGGAPPRRRETGGWTL